MYFDILLKFYFDPWAFFFYFHYIWGGGGGGLWPDG